MWHAKKWFLYKYLLLAKQKKQLQYNKTYNPCNFDAYQNYDNVLLTAMFIGIIDGDGSIDKSGLNITITTHCS